MWLLLATALVVAAEPDDEPPEVAVDQVDAPEWGAALTDALVAAGGYAEQTARITRELGERADDPDATDRLTRALAVLSSLQGHGATDADTVRSYLAPALCPDPAVRAAAAAAAVTLSPPPAVPVAPVVADTIVFDEETVRSERIPGTGSGVGEEVLDEGLATYRERALTRSEGTDWTVTDGRGRTLDPTRFAERVGDWTGLDRLERARTRGVTGGIGLIASGIVLAGAGVGIATLGEPTTGTLAGGAAVAVAGAGLAGGGGGLIAVTFGRHRSMPRSYTPADADALVERHNDALRTELLLAPEDVR